MAAPWTGVRQYSLCGDPADRARWRIAVLHEPDGRGGSAYLHRAAQPGSALRVSTPRNNFELIGSDSYVVLAGGIGITPILPMVAAAEAAGARWSLYYGGRTRGHMAFADAIRWRTRCRRTNTVCCRCGRSSPISATPLSRFPARGGRP
ncbi:ferredoxin reductase [Nocardia beijingensis]|uniref:ferredoxin reductase n=1 Tax=Nocardia beijingensis TaxID=95162 RepID=UPI0033347DF8